MNSPHSQKSGIAFYRTFPATPDPRMHTEKPIVKSLADWPLLGTISKSDSVSCSNISNIYYHHCRHKLTTEHLHKSTTQYQIGNLTINSSKTLLLCLYFHMFLPTQNLVIVRNLVIVSDKSTNHQSQNLNYIVNALIQKEKIC